MSQDLRDLLANRRFAIPLIILLGFCFVGLILIGIVLIWRPGSQGGGETVADVTATAASEATARPTQSAIPTRSPTPRPSATMVSLSTEVASSSGGTPVTSTGGEGTPTTTEATTEATAQATATPQATATLQAEDELADTGVGWGLVLFSAVGLAGLAIVARRLRMAH
jgi:cell division septation protein DedD